MAPLRVSIPLTQEREAVCSAQVEPDPVAYAQPSEASTAAAYAIIPLNNNLRVCTYVVV